MPTTLFLFLKCSSLDFFCNSSIKSKTLKDYTYICKLYIGPYYYITVPVDNYKYLYAKTDGVLHNI